MRKISPWISVKRRFPDDNVDVLVETSAGHKYMASRYDDEWVGRDVREYLLEQNEITHWMTIPD